MLAKKFACTQSVDFFTNWTNHGLFCVNFLLFETIQFKYNLIKAQMVCLGLKPEVAGWKVDTIPLSYGGTPKPIQQILH